MSRLGEKDVLIPALNLVKENSNISTSKIIEILSSTMYLSQEDKELLKNRKDTKFSQIIRNLCGSHAKSNLFSKSVYVNKIKNIRCFSINETGKDFLKYYVETIEEIDNLYQDAIQKSTSYTNSELIKANGRYPKKYCGIKNRYIVDRKIAKTVLKMVNYKCEYALLNNVDHKTFITKNGVQYQEAHHLIPMKAQKDFKINLDRSENIISLCPICHSAIHLGDCEEKKKILQVLYNEKIKKINKAGIFITFEDLYNKYYK